MIPPDLKRRFFYTTITSMNNSRSQIKHQLKRIKESRKALKMKSIKYHLLIKSKRSIKYWLCISSLLIIILMILNEHGRILSSSSSSSILVSGHIVLTKDDYSQSLVLTGEDGKGGKGKGGGGDQLVIAGNNMGGGGQSSNMIMQDADNREGDVVINGNSMIIPGEDGHIVLADGRSNSRQQNFRPPPTNLFAFWLPYMNQRSMMPFNMMQIFGGGQFG